MALGSGKGVVDGDVQIGMAGIRVLLRNDGSATRARP
jgi:hypothetical protein